jgi:flagellar hook protein FlgE
MSGAIEMSNVDLSEQLVNLISAQRYFQANSRAIDVDSQAFRSIYELR